MGSGRIDHYPARSNLRITVCLWNRIRNADISGMEFSTRCARGMFHSCCIWRGQMVNRLQQGKEII